MLADRSLGVPHVSRFSRRGYSHCRHPRDLSLDWGKAPTSGDDDDEDAVLVLVNGRGGEIQRLVVQAVCCALLEKREKCGTPFWVGSGRFKKPTMVGTPQMCATRPRLAIPFFAGITGSRKARRGAQPGRARHKIWASIVGAVTPAISLRAVCSRLPQSRPRPLAQQRKVD